MPRHRCNTEDILLPENLPAEPSLIYEFFNRAEVDFSFYENNEEPLAFKLCG